MEAGPANILMIFFATIGPIKAAVVYASLTANTEPGFRRGVAIKTVVTATCVCLLFVVAGEFLLQVFHVSLPALKIAGGLILMLVAIGMVMGDSSGPPDPDGPGPSADIAVFPLAIPMMATPQGIVLITTFSATTTNITEMLTLVGLILAIMAFNLGFLLAADKIISGIGPSILQVITRILGLLLLGLAVQMMMWGLVDLNLLEPTL
jgi:multiple antibiotic resistance protein